MFFLVKKQTKRIFWGEEVAENINEASSKSFYKSEVLGNCHRLKFGEQGRFQSSQRKRLASNSLTLKISENKGV